MSHIKQTKSNPLQFPLVRGKVLSLRGTKQSKETPIIDCRVATAPRNDNSNTKNQKLKTQNYFAFTLVELIVVIVILAILATIAFLSFNSYSSSSRDSVRLSDINSLNKSLELFNISAAKYPDPTNVYMTVVYSGGAIFEQGKLGDSVITAVQKMSKKPVDPLKNTEYTYSVNMTNTAFQLKADLETKQTTTGFNNIPHLTPAYRQAGHSNTGEELISSVIENETAPISSFGAKGNGVEEPAYRQAGLENNSSSLLSNVFNGLKDISTTLRSAQYDDIIGMTNQTNADINSGSTVCYIKGNFNGLIEKTNTGNTNYILAVPGLVLTDSGSSSTNTMIDYNTLSGKVLCSGYNYPCIITYTPTVVFTGTPTTTTDITNMMTSLQGAYSGSNAATTNSTISNLLNSSGTTLVSLGTSVVSKIGIANNITTTPCIGSITDINAHSTATSENGTNWHYLNTPGACSRSCNTNYSWNGTSCYLPGWPTVDSNCTKPDVVIGGQTWAGCNSTIGSLAQSYAGECYDYNGTNIGGTACHGITTKENRSGISSSAFGYNSGINGISDNMYGGMYPWDTLSSNSCFAAGIAGSNSICPCKGGYHIPSNTEWDTLETALGCSGGEKLTGVTTGWECLVSNTGSIASGLGWKSNNSNSIKNILGIPLAGGYWSSASRNRGLTGYSWSNTQFSTTHGWSRTMQYLYASIARDTNGKTTQIAVRCVKD